ncbi:MAG: MFS transporter, partial [Dermatophilaceae bacterium]
MKDSLQEFRRPLVRPTVRVILGASAVSLIGDAMAMVALVLRVHGAGHGPLAVTALLLCFAAPVVLTMGIAGALADRVDPRRLLATTALVQAAAAGGLAVVDGLLATFALVALLQTAFALGSPAWTTVVPSLVEPEDVGRVLSVQQALRGVASPVGAALGGLLVQTHGAGAALAANAATFLVLAAGAAATPARREPRSTNRADGGGRAAGPAARAGGARAASGLRNLSSTVLPRDGVAALRTRPVAWVLVMALLPFIVVLESVNVVEVFLVRDVLGASPAQYGAADAVHGASAVAGALAAGTVTRRPT